jgi:hypothetical protein
MKRVLLIAHVFPPQPSPGALRPGYLAKYLPQFGWEATVLTQSVGAPPFQARVFTTGAVSSPFEARLRTTVASRSRDPFSPLRRTLRAVKDALLFPDATAPWIRPARKLGIRLMREERFAAILSTALPATVHVVAADLARRFGVPWVADYRDPWAGNAYVKRGPIRTYLEQTLERRLLRRAASITTISRPIAEQLRAFHRRETIAVIPNAYDPAEWDALPDLRPSRFDLCYTGSMYDGKRSPDLLFAAIAQLRVERDAAAHAARVHFYGPNSDNVEQSVLRYGLTLQVRQHGVVPRAQAMRAQRSAAALLIFLNMDPATGNELGSKILEYVGARRHIIAFGPPNSIMRDFLRRHRLGWFASTVDEAKAALQAAHARFAAGTYELTIDGRAFPTATDLARRFADQLNAAMDDAALTNSARFSEAL